MKDKGKGIGAGVAILTAVGLWLWAKQAGAEEPVFPCPYCGDTFSSQALLDAHIALEHPEEPPPEGLIGDLDDDGVIDLGDLDILQKYIVGYPISLISPLSEEEFLRRADVNGDGVVNELDIAALETLIAGNGGNGAGFYWLRPTGHIANGWNDAELAYDGWTDTRAEVVDVGTQRWSPYLEFTFAPTEISAVCWWASSPVSPKKVQVDVISPGGAYQNIYEGGATMMWEYGLYIPGGSRVISGARIRFYNPAHTVQMKFRVNEFQFLGYAEGPPAPPEPPPGTRLYGHVTDQITGVPVAGAMGTVYQDKDTDTWDHDLITNAAGYYEITGMINDADQNRMVIYAAGYVAYTKEHVSISEGDNRLNVQMEPE